MKNQPKLEDIAKKPNGKLHILVADDEEDVLRYDSHFFGEYSKGKYHVVFARDGQEVIEKAKREKFDLVVLDLMMPILSGEEVYMHLKKNDPQLAKKVLIRSTVLGTSYAHFVKAEGIPSLHKYAPFHEYESKIQEVLNNGH